MKYPFIILYLTTQIDCFTYDSEPPKELIDKGRYQYQLLKERGTLPQYGDCWKSAVVHVDEACKHLSEDTQSDIALHLTNCFLQMSGHDVYDCELDKKPNLRAICINSMTDRAFNVYTEFYTHTQNICWFLRGQIWHELISENTLKVGKQLKFSVENQEELLRTQKESLQLQQKMLEDGKFLQEILGNLYATIEGNGEILRMFGESLENLEGLIVGKLSWFESLLFYIGSIFVILFLTSTKRTKSSRDVALILIFSNFLTERLISYLFISGSDANLNDTIKNLQLTIWYCRYLFILMILIYIIYSIYIYKDFIIENHILICKLSEKNDKILDKLHSVEKCLTLTSTINYNDDLLLNNLRKDCNLNSSLFNQNFYDEKNSTDGNTRKYFIESRNTNRYNLRNKTPILNYDKQ